ncbi:MAG: sulfurtransferase [Bacteroidia bacterium]|nr:sulfurtransferase [Bacteroidia bacterium]
MKTFKIFCWSIVFALFSAFYVNAQTEVLEAPQADIITNVETDIITAKEFTKLMKANKDLVILEASKSKIYKKSHVKNAIYINHNDLNQDGEIKGLIKSNEELASYFGSKGVSADSEVVIYDDGSQKYSTRVYWILKYLGADNVKILHKDMDAWGKARISLTSNVPKIKPTTFTLNPNPAIFATKEDVKILQSKDNAILFDARTKAEYDGTSEKPASDGHIVGAVNLDYKDLLTETGAFKSKDELMAIASTMGITPGTEIVAYCRTSVRAAVIFVAFRNILGYENVRVYDGAYLEWAIDSPIVQ